MKRMILAALLSLTVPAACTGPEEDSQAASEGVEGFSIEGSWTGEDRERIHATEGYSTGRATMDVQKTEGRTFVAEMTWVTSDGNISERFVGAMTPDANLISGAGADGTVDFEVIDEDTLYYCYTETGEDEYLTVCARLTRDQ